MVKSTNRKTSEIKKIWHTSKWVEKVINFYQVATWVLVEMQVIIIKQLILTTLDLASLKRLEFCSWVTRATNIRKQLQKTAKDQKLFRRMVPVIHTKIVLRSWENRHKWNCKIRLEIFNHKSLCFQSHHNCSKKT